MLDKRMSRNVEAKETAPDRVESARAQWAVQRPDLDPAWIALLGRLGDAAAIVARDHLEPLFAGFGLRPGEFDVLAALRRAGPPFALSPTALYEGAMITSSAMTNRIDRLEAAGLVTRRPDPEDRRGRRVVLTASGRALIDRVIAAHVANEARVLAGLTEAEQHSLAALLRKLVAGLPRPG